MSVVSEILNLRQDQFSSVSRLLAAIDWQRSAFEGDHRLYRSVAVAEAVDLVLLNVAAHVADQLNEPPTTRKTRQSVIPFRRKPRRSDPGQLRQRRLFA